MTFSVVLVFKGCVLTFTRNVQVPKTQTCCCYSEWNVFVVTLDVGISGQAEHRPQPAQNQAQQQPLLPQQQPWYEAQQQQAQLPQQQPRYPTPELIDLTADSDSESDQPIRLPRLYLEPFSDN
jgi:hypothetical protein